MTTRQRTALVNRLTKKIKEESAITFEGREDEARWIVELILDAAEKKA